MKTQQDNLVSWKKLKQIGIISIWKTPTRYAVVFQYDHLCFFYATLEEATEKAKHFFSKKG